MQVPARCCLDSAWPRAGTACAPAVLHEGRSQGHHYVPIDKVPSLLKSYLFLKNQLTPLWALCLNIIPSFYAIPQCFVPGPPSTPFLSFSHWPPLTTSLARQSLSGETVVTSSVLKCRLALGRSSVSGFRLCLCQLRLLESALSISLPSHLWVGQRIPHPNQIGGISKHNGADLTFSVKI